MSRVRGRGNKATELALIAIFRRQRITGWRRRRPLFGNPDFVFQSSRLAVFVDGCFWHGCPQHGSQPTSNQEFWRRKFAKNKSRDRIVRKTLEAAGWNVFRIWQHELLRRNEAALVRRIRKKLAPDRSLH